MGQLPRFLRDKCHFSINIHIVYTYGPNLTHTHAAVNYKSTADNLAKTCLPG